MADKTKIAKFKTPDGRIARFRVPADTTPEQAQEYGRQFFLQQQGTGSRDVDKMGALERFGEGAAAGISDLILGGKQLLNIGDQETLKEVIKAKRELEEPLLKTKSGLAGNIGGKIAAELPAMFIPGANTIVGGGLIGTGLGALEPTTNTSDTAGNALIGALGGAGGVALGKTIPGLINKGAGLFTQKGANKAAGKALIGSTDDALEAIRKLQGAERFVPGSTPTVAEATQDAGLARLQKAVRNLQAGKAISEREIANNTARANTIRGIAKTDADIAAAKLARDEVGKVLYSVAGKQKIPIGQQLGDILSSPEIQKAAKSIGVPSSALSRNKPLINVSSGQKIPNEVTVDNLHKIKIALDDMANFNPTTAQDRLERSAIIGAKQKLLDYLDEAVPDYRLARNTFFEQSKPYNQMQVGQALKEKLIPALADVTDNPEVTRNNAEAFARAIRDQDKTIKGAMGFRDKSLQDVMTPDQMKTINGILQDLTRKSNADSLMAARGSDTAQNLIGNNFLRNKLASGLIPGDATTNLLTKSLFDMIMPGIEHSSHSTLANAMIDPDLAAALMEAAMREAAKSGTRGRLLPLIGANLPLSQMQ